jgi:ubiquitin carboxyl-terminal hydrolase 34
MITGNYLCCYKELTEMLKGEYGLSLLSSIDFIEFTKSLITILDGLLERPVLSQEMMFLINEISFLLKIFFAYQPDLYDIIDKTHNVPNILLKGILFAKGPAVEDTIQQLAYFLCANISSNDKDNLPLILILKAFLDSRIIFNRYAKMSLYELIKLLLGLYKKLKNEESIDTIAKFTEIMDYFTDCSSLEASNSIEAKAPLLGLLELASDLILVTSFIKQPDADRLMKYIRQIFFGGLFPDTKGKFICRAVDTRHMAYTLIIRISQLYSICLINLIRDCMLPLRKKVAALNVWGYAHTNHERSILGYTGLKNMGCICYINSMLQQFFLIAPFRNAIVSIRDNKEPNYADNGIDDNLIHQFQRTFVYLMNSTRRDFNPGAFCYSFKEFDGKPTNTAIQHDAHEFLNILFERLEQEFKSTTYAQLMQSVFGGKFSSQVICSNCGHVSSTYEDYYTLSLEIKNQRTLDDSLERFIAGSTISEYLCDHCKERVNAIRRTLISTLPNILIIHLQRFSYNFNTFMIEKIHTRLEFPNILNMTNYTEEGHSKVEQKSPKDIMENEKEMDEKNAKVKFDIQESKKDLKEQEYYTYKLVGVLMHNGNAEAGHYYSYINIDRQSTNTNMNTEDDHWLEFNDSIISEFAFSKLGVECFGGTMEDTGAGYMDENSEVAKLIGGRSKSAYMLFYERQKKDMIPLKVIPTNLKETISSPLECDSTAVSSTGNNTTIINLEDNYYYYD